MLKILKYMNRRDWLFVVCSLVFIVCGVGLDLRLPDYMREITALVQTPGSEMGEILSAGGSMLLCALGSLVTAFIVGFFVAQIAAGLAMRLREAVYNKTMDFSMEEIGKFSTASLITRTTNDIQQIQMFVALGLQAMIKAPILAVWAILKIAGKSWQWTAITGGAVAILTVMLGTVIALVLPKFKNMQKLTDNLNRVARENLTGIRVVRAYNAEGYQEKKFEGANEELTRTNLFTSRTMGGYVAATVKNLKEREGQNGICICCGKETEQAGTGRPRKFCSEKCRRQWWKTHPQEGSRKSLCTKKCECCGREFSFYRSRKPKYCSYDCYIKARFWRD